MSVISQPRPYLGWLAIIGIVAGGFPLLLEHPAMLGIVAASCTTLSFLPQVIHTFKTRDTSGISLSMYIIFVFGVFCWLVYGLKSGDIPLISGNGITLLLASTVLFLKIKTNIKEGNQNTPV
ncbi:SemiSWEET transporter [Photobacterium sp. SDRW27]|uniref:SemiSWEET transporter n=1 Tax=Photobacterium obscurum TaxID=2829490 RepID=UPI0022435CE0|nr:SemiSWEET transporter [Photobacterium obscurum]MCW8331033.1 SemiSWEET transporter [Photobacterium obscurum]